MPSWILPIVTALKQPFVWVADQMNIKDRLYERRLAAERFRDRGYRIADDWDELAALFRQGLTVDHLPAMDLLRELGSDLLYLQREGLNEVLTRCRGATHPAAEDMATAAAQVQDALDEMVANAPRSGGSAYVRTRPIEETYIGPVETEVSHLTDANTAFISSARKDLR